MINTGQFFNKTNMNGSLVPCYRNYLSHVVFRCDGYCRACFVSTVFLSFDSKCNTYKTQYCQKCSFLAPCDFSVLRFCFCNDVKTSFIHVCLVFVYNAALTLHAELCYLLLVMLSLFLQVFACFFCTYLHYYLYVSTQSQIRNQFYMYIFPCLCFFCVS